MAQLLKQHRKPVLDAARVDDTPAMDRALGVLDVQQLAEIRILAAGPWADSLTESKVVVLLARVDVYAAALAAIAPAEAGPKAGVASGPRQQGRPACSPEPRHEPRSAPGPKHEPRRPAATQPRARVPE